MALTLRALGAACAVVALTACATTPPVAPATATATPSLGADPGGTPSPGATSPAATLTTTPATAGLVLQAAGLDRARFGTAEGAVTALLTAAAGKPDESFSGRVCELDSGSAYGRQLVYGGAVFGFQSKAKGTKDAARTFTSWVINLEQPLKPGLAVAPGYPVDPTFAELRTAYPKGKMSRVALGESTVHVFTTPSGIWYRGDDNRTPNDMGAGPMGSCE